MARLEIEGCHVSADVNDDSKRASVIDNGASISFRGCIDDETHVAWLSISATTIDRQIRPGHSMLDVNASIDGIRELEMLHAYLGAFIDQYKSLPINKK